MKVLISVTLLLLIALGGVYLTIIGVLGAYHNANGILDYIVFGFGLTALTNLVISYKNSDNF